MTPDDTPGRRELNRRRTEQDLHEAALACVERDGYRGATTTRIAEAAGVSPRTFFRHFATKDEALAPGQPRVRRRIERLELPDDAAAALSAVADLFEEILGGEEILPELEELPRYEQILAETPELRSTFARHDAEIAEALVSRLLTHLPDEDPLTVHLAAEVVMAMWRTAWALWRDTAIRGADRPGDEGPASTQDSPLANFRACRRGLAPALDALLG